MNDIALPAASRLDTRDLRLILALATARTTAAARRVIEFIEAVVRFNLTAHAPPPQAEAVREMLARLPGEVASR